MKPSVDGGQEGRGGEKSFKSSQRFPRSVAVIKPKEQGDQFYPLYPLSPFLHLTRWSVVSGQLMLVSGSIVTKTYSHKFVSPPSPQYVIVDGNRRGLLRKIINC